MEDPREQRTIARICELFDGKTSLHKIVKIWTDEGHQPKEKGAWSRLAVARILERKGRQAMRPWNRTNAIRDKTTVQNRIFELKAEGLNLSEIGRQLTRENMMPVRGNKWYPATVSAYISERASYNQDAIKKTVLALREQKRTLSQICANLTLRGFTPQRGERWFPAQITTILDANQGPSRSPKAA